MIIGGIDIIGLIAILMSASTPVLLAATGELVAEKSGVLNLGVEGMMIMGAVAGFAAAVATGNPVLGFLGGAIAGALMATLFAVITQIFLSNQVASGLALTLFGLGLSALIGKGYEGVRPPPTAKIDFGPLSDIPVLGRIVFSHDWMVYLSLLLVVVVWIVLRYTRVGLVLRAVGESHDAAHALGYRVVAVRFAALAFGGALAGLGGAYLSLVRVPQWTEGMTAGAGWIALAIVVFASWRPWRVLLGAYMFGGITALQLQLQAAGYAIPVHILSMAPYVITIVVLVILSAIHRHGVQAAPASLGKSFHASS
ncbi:ABC transporter permease [Thioclava sp. BHET1]|uniref:ABC transporter permease n=1 Tax=Thioclava dalianensis TaxID=1185766 RepID=A0A074TJA3_9RHOB|nr:ABC transporter permease [Thioclava dalianensis]KEP70220.1 ABC transporter permease [Thioclava dalianensis]TMV88241.1 ABC transporter permease [Thioclava sp. BHET1]SFM82242.1 simple sugar transport system permease protein [Thioclava dalianensis]